ncbi:MAG: DUF3422 domain-containing protein [Alphaproteobacteria bacterium]|nr:DUF3422 domain-containing protein [Alphaproteobacteria bacterium]
MSQEPAKTAATAFAGGPVLHPLFDALARELHARPYGVAAAPARVVHLALTGGDSAAERTSLTRLCAMQNAPMPPPGASHVQIECDGLRLTWERHAEFATYTFVLPWRGTALFEPVSALALPHAWIAALPGQTIAAVQLALIAGEPPTPEAIAELFEGRNIVGGFAAGGLAQLWTDFRSDRENFVRMIVHGGAMSSPRQAGRLVQRLLEIETYTMMALLALPLAREINPAVTETERNLARIAEATTGVEALEEEQALLKRLLSLAAELATLGARTPYRFGAARAYYALVQKRIEELRERRIEGRQTVGEFMERRLSPAMRTCETMERRLEALSERVARASDMLRTRIDVTLAAQNRDLLLSMNRRARLQLRLQQTVEFLSIAAITYYGAGLVGHVAHGAAALGYAVNEPLVVAASVPVISGLLLVGLWAFHKWLGRD